MKGQTLARTPECGCWLTEELLVFRSGEGRELGHFKEVIANDAKPGRQERGEELAGANQMSDQHFIQTVFQRPPRGD